MKDTESRKRITNVHTLENVKHTYQIRLCRKYFVRPDDQMSDEDDLELDDVEDVMLLTGLSADEDDDDDDDIAVPSPFEIRESDQDDDLDDSDDDLDSDESSDPLPTRSAAQANSSKTRAPNMRAPAADYDDDDDDEVVRAIIAATKTPRSHPPDIATDDFVVDLSFHPDADILAVGTLTGDVLVYKYSNDENTLMNTLEVHTKAIRDIEFNLDGTTLFSTSKDRSVMLSDVHTGKLKRFYDSAHEVPVYQMSVFDENLFATGIV